MPTIKNILKELDNALHTNDFSKFLSMLRQDPKCLRAKFEKHHITLLHKLCSINIAAITNRNLDEDKYKVIEKELGKKFKIICLDAEDTTALKVFVPEARGLYTTKNSVFIATKGLDINEILACIMHESSHFIINQLFKNSSQPFPPGNYSNPLKDKFDEVLKITQKRLPNISDNNSNDKAYAVLETVYSAYPEKEWAAELIVRVPQIVALLGAEQGHAWLEKNAPELYNFYESTINPKIKEYLQEQKSVNYINDSVMTTPQSTSVKKDKLG